MPFLRFSRDKRGYEHTYLIHASTKRAAPARILYWYRTPPGVKVGRMAFDADVRKALEAQYPSITFDWSRLMDTPTPPPDVEHWRERRRQEKAARQVRTAIDRGDPDDRHEDEGSAPETHSGDRRRADQPAAEESGLVAAPPADAARDLAPPVQSAGGPLAQDPGARPRKRRRRGGRRRRPPGPGEATEMSAPDLASGSADGDGGGGLDAAAVDSGPAVSESQE